MTTRRETACRTIAVIMVAACTAACTAATDAPVRPAREPFVPRLAFTDVSHRIAAAPFVRTLERGSITGGIAAVDLDRDGDLDLVATQHEGPLVALRNDGALRFTEIPEWLPPIERTTSLALLDVEGDGDRDLFVGRDGGAVLLRNDGDAWRDGTVDAGLRIDGYVTGAVAADLDRDGLLDLFVLRFDALDGHGWPPGQPDQLWLGTGGGRFRLAAQSPGGGEPDVAPTLAAGVADLDDDSWLDIVVANDMGPFDRPTQVWRNLGRGSDGELRFEDVARTWGIEARIFGMGVALDDLDGDGRIDVYLTNAGENPLFVSDGDGPGFIDRAAELGAACGHFPDPDPPQADPPAFRDFGPTADNPTPEMVEFLARYTDPELGQWTLTSWSPIAFDPDGDGDLDLFVTHGATGLRSLMPEGPGQPQVMLRAAGGRFDRLGLPDFPDRRDSARGALAADLDADGDDDLAWVANGYDQEAGVRVLANTGTSGRVLELHLVGAGEDLEALGSRISVTVGEHRLVRHVRTGSGFASGAPPLTRIAVGGAEMADAIEVRWPRGAISRLGPTPAGVRVTIREP